MSRDILNRPDVGGRTSGLGKNADRVRTTCKRRCGAPLLHGQPAVWLTGTPTGLAHEDCDQPDGPEVRRGR